MQKSALDTHRLSRPKGSKHAKQAKADNVFQGSFSTQLTYLESDIQVDHSWTKGVANRIVDPDRAYTDMAPFRPGDTHHDQRLPGKFGFAISPTRHYLGSGNGGRRTGSLPPVEAVNAVELEGGSSPPLNSATDDPFHNDWKNW